MDCMIAVRMAGLAAVVRQVGSALAFMHKRDSTEVLVARQYTKSSQVEGFGLHPNSKGQESPSDIKWPFRKWCLTADLQKISWARIEVNELTTMWSRKTFCCGSVEPAPQLIQLTLPVASEEAGAWKFFPHGTELRGTDLGHRTRSMTHFFQLLKASHFDPSPHRMKKMNFHDRWSWLTLAWLNALWSENEIWCPGCSERIQRSLGSAWFWGLAEKTRLFVRVFHSAVRKANAFLVRVAAPFKFWMHFRWESGAGGVYLLVHRAWRDVTGLALRTPPIGFGCRKGIWD